MVTNMEEKSLVEKAEDREKTEIQSLLEEYRKLYRTDSKSAKSRRTEVRARLKELGCPAEMTYRARHM